MKSHNYFAGYATPLLFRGIVKAHAAEKPNSNILAENAKFTLNPFSLQLRKLELSSLPFKSLKKSEILLIALLNNCPFSWYLTNRETYCGTFFFSLNNLPIY